jgi:putative two-component system response regulator
MYDVTTEKRAQETLRRSHEETVRRLSTAAELRDDETGAHIERVSRYCELIAERLGLDPAFRDELRIASPMHDVGKIGIPDAILLKPGPLTPEERAEMERHAEIGYRVLTGSGAELLELAATIAWTHHERFDGSGYPRGLSGETIPLEGRIAAVADVFDALTSDRVYRKALPYEEAIALLRDGRGSQFDPRVVDAFLEADDEIRAIMRARTTPSAASR